MKLKDLLKGISPLSATADPETEIARISYDSRTTAAGDLFVAMTGFAADGHAYIPKAMAAGAAAVVCERAPAEGNVPYVRVDDARRALAVMAANYYGHPADDMTMVAVTGTNGKTTTTYLLKAILEQEAGAKVGLIGTNQDMIGDQVIPTERTTPESLELQELFARMRDAGCTHVVMEASSHALVLHRLDGIRFAAGIFTNLTQDHLDFHRTMEAYRDAKGLLFRQCDTAVLNLDDEAGRYYAATAPCPVFTYSERRDEADLTAKNLRLFPQRVEFEAVTMEAIARVKLAIPGGFTIYNALAALSCGVTLGLTLNDCAGALARAHGVKGRIEVVSVPADFTVLIDYAHTPDALENILTTVRDFTSGRVLCLFGCGGDRDRSKRPQMGAIAGNLADVAVVTSDNPRTEDPEAIIRDILAGMEGTPAQRHVEPDRRRAIALALSLAEPGDTVVLAGKGHETYQEINGVQHHLDEREEIAAWFAK